MAEQSVTVEVEGRRLRLSNLDKVLYPATGTTKGEVLHYYAQVAPVLLPHLADRAVTRIRWPNGTAEEKFFEKNLPVGAPDWLRSVTVSSTGSRGGGDTIELPGRRGRRRPHLPGQPRLAGAARPPVAVRPQQPAAEPRPPGGRPRPGPSRRPRTSARQVALLVRDRLAQTGLATAPVTSGSKGLHLYAALPARLNADEVRDLAKKVAQELPRTHPRPGAVADDQGDAGAARSSSTGARTPGRKTTISPYSLRGRAAPYVAAPRTWDEVEEGAEKPGALQHLAMAEVLSRVEETGDVFGDLLHQG